MDSDGAAVELVHVSAVPFLDGFGRHADERPRLRRHHAPSTSGAEDRVDDRRTGQTRRHGQHDDESVTRWRRHSRPTSDDRPARRRAVWRCRLPSSATTRPRRSACSWSASRVVGGCDFRHPILFADLAEPVAPPGSVSTPTRSSPRSAGDRCNDLVSRWRRRLVVGFACRWSRCSKAVAIVTGIGRGWVAASSLYRGGPTWCWRLAVKACAVAEEIRDLGRIARGAHRHRGRSVRRLVDGTAKFGVDIFVQNGHHPVTGGGGRRRSRLVARHHGDQLLRCPQMVQRGPRDDRARRRPGDSVNSGAMISSPATMGAHSASKAAGTLVRTLGGVQRARQRRHARSVQGENYCCSCPARPTRRRKLWSTNGAGVAARPHPTPDECAGAVLFFSPIWRRRSPVSIWR